MTRIREEEEVKISDDTAEEMINLLTASVYMSQTRDQQVFTVSEVATDRHKLVVPQNIIEPSVTISEHSV